LSGRNTCGTCIGKSTFFNNRDQSKNAPRNFVNITLNLIYFTTMNLFISYY